LGLKIIAEILAGFIFHKCVKNVTHICKKCVKLGKLCLVGLDQEYRWVGTEFFGLGLGSDLSLQAPGFKIQKWA
jgi:hypothetical protein